MHKALVYDTPVNIDTLRISTERDITQNKVVYLEFKDGMALSSDELLEADEVFKDILVDAWYSIYGNER